MVSIPDSPRLRDVLERGDDPADLIGFGWLSELVTAAGLVPIDRRAAQLERERHKLAWHFDPDCPMGAVIVNPVHLAMLCRWAVELLEDVDLLAFLLTGHPRADELAADLLSMLDGGDDE